jgi:hypothetical protein
MVKGIAVPIISVCLLGACGAFCQSAPKGLPDAPSFVARQSAPVHIEAIPTGKWLSTESAIAMSPTASLPARPILVFETARQQKESGTFFSRYLDTSFAKQGTRYQASSKDSVLGRATDAAARIFVTRDETGRRRLNTSYFVGVLTSVAAHNAARPYWARSNSNPIGDLGSTVGNDAGMNLMHEFGPGLRQAVAGHMPSFVFRVQRRIVRNVNANRPIPGPR